MRQQVFVDIPTCTRCVNYEVNKWKSSFDGKAEELAYGKAQFDLQIKVLQTSTTLRIDELQSQHEVQIKDLLSRLTFLRLRFENESADSVPEADVVILIQDREDAPLYAHKLILASKSPVFRRMFHSEMLEGKTEKIRIVDTTLPVMHAVIKFFYCAEINFTDEVSAEDVLAVAHKYDVDLLQTICEEHLIKTIGKINLSKILKLARKFDTKKLEAGALAFLKSHFDEFADDVELS